MEGELKDSDQLRGLLESFTRNGLLCTADSDLLSRSVDKIEKYERFKAAHDFLDSWLAQDKDVEIDVSGGSVCVRLIEHYGATTHCMENGATVLAAVEEVMDSMAARRRANTNPRKATP